MGLDLEWGSTEGRVMVRLCGGLTITGPLGTLSPRDLGGVKPRLVLVALLVDPGRPVGRDRLGQLLWGDHPPAGYDSTLAAYVSLLRKRLASVSPSAARMVRTAPGGYLVDPEVLVLDTLGFDLLVQEARSAPRVLEALGAYDRALETVLRPWLAGDDSAPWLQDERRAHERRVSAVLREGSTLALRSGDVGRAELWARRLLELEPFDETAWRTLLEALDGQSRPADGLREYVVCRQLFADELGCAPGSAVREVFERLLHRTRTVSSSGLDVLVDAVVRLHDLHSSSSAASPHAVRAVGELERSVEVLEHLLERVHGAGLVRPA